ncbi:hypothetical protein Val02_61550 [Virgisporangium aliadipatigenens]|uniref:DUF3618 domain-containing protein n=1 Tax=Virgisporangium aliadipatigenens TaxID=741659 RepID=A0A8J4DSZ9_9ACTN|nr:DUF3618 domain-containing protein [Virgisporangium aliadipatigenens]GIJ49269.1 hypothetical protein Val02_61550 [Virgisporangium aliadipatigenens]
MAAEPDRLRQDIENTRASLTRDVDLLAEKTSPRKATQRRWNAVKERVMGSADQARHAAGSATSTVADTASRVGDAAGEKAHEAADAVRSAPRAVAEQTQGNPIAVGIIAFGVGLLAATLIPATDAERRAGQQLKEHGGDLADRVKDVATEVKDDLSDDVRQAVGQVKETARDAARTTGEQARSSSQEATERTRQAAQNPT